MVSEEEKSRQRRQLAKEAISLAMQGRWREAVAANRSLVDIFSGDVEAYNRMGRAHLELGEYDAAKAAYDKAVELDPFNSIAKKNLQRLKYLEESDVAADVETPHVDPQHFIEELGKAGVVKLYALGARETLARLVAGDVLRLRKEGFSLIVEDTRGQYVGQVDPRHAQRLAKLIEGGNEYSAAVVSSSDGAVTVIIREVRQDPSQVGKLSFPPRGLEEVRPYVSDRILKLEEAEEEAAGEPGYTIIGGEDIEVLEESKETDEESEEE